MHLNSTKGLLASVVSILPKSDLRKLTIVAAIQILLSLFDLAGVAAIGILGALSVSGIQSRQPGDRVGNILEFLGINSWQFQDQVAVIGLFAAMTLIFRTVMSIYLTKRTLIFLSHKSAFISSKLISRFLNQPLLSVESRTTQENIYALSIGVDLVTMQIIGSFVALVTDAALLLVLSIGLIVVDPQLAIFTLAIFGSVGALIYFRVYQMARKIGVESNQFSIESNEKIAEAINSYRETFVGGRRSHYVEAVSELRHNLAGATAKLSFLPNLSKYIFEALVILGGLALGAIQFLTQDAAHAVATLSIFMAAGSRIAPAVLRIQQSFTQFQSASGLASPTLQLIDELRETQLLQDSEYVLDMEHSGFNSNIEIERVGFKYPTRENAALKDISLKIPEGHFVAIVGPTGSGKSTLVDVLLGLIEPDTGKVLISGMPPKKAIDDFPGAISYVPQEVNVYKGSLKENLTRSFPKDSFLDQDIQVALGFAKLDSFAQSLPAGINTLAGDGGTNLSGGQRQRIGVARAYLTRPKLIVLDEATSSVDGVTEDEIYKSIATVKGKVTVIVIAHRLSSIRDADLVVYLENGAIKYSGSFEDVRKNVPEFNQQARVMGL
jgi:ABC-type multidrug transport system fused ATPase/permease subunit